MEKELRDHRNANLLEIGKKKKKKERKKLIIVRLNNKLNLAKQQSSSHM